MGVGLVSKGGGGVELVNNYKRGLVSMGGGRWRAPQEMSQVPFRYLEFYLFEIEATGLNEVDEVYVT